MRLEEREMDICEYLEHPFENALLLDVRSKTMFSFGSLPEAVNLPMEEVGRLYELPRDRKICVFCQAGEISRPVTEEYIQKVIGPTLHDASSGEGTSE